MERASLLSLSFILGAIGQSEITGELIVPAPQVYPTEAEYLTDFNHFHSLSAIKIISGTNYNGLIAI